MIARLFALCAIEVGIVVWLALQVFGTASAGGPALDSKLVPSSEAADLSLASPLPEHGERDKRVDEQRMAGPADRRVGAAKWRPDDTVGVMLTGKVSWADGSPVAEPSVFARESARRHLTGSGKAGSYAIVGLTPGLWTIYVHSDGGVHFSEQVTIVDDAVQHRDFVLQRSYPLGVKIVTKDGDDATKAVRTKLGHQMANFFVAGQSAPFPERFAASDYGTVFVGDARWERFMNSRDGVAGTIHLASAPPQHVALLHRHTVLSQQVVQVGQNEVKFIVDLDELRAIAASVTVRVLDAVTGNPIQDAWMSLDTSNSAGNANKSDADGRIVHESLSPGLLRCQISAPEREMRFTTVAIEPGQRLDLGDVRLGPSIPFKGKIVDAAGKPVAGASIHWHELKNFGGPRPFATNRGTGSDAEGKFKLSGTGRGAIVVAASTKEGQRARGVFFNPPTEDVVLRLAEPALCTVTHPADPQRSFYVVLFDAQRRPVAGFEIRANDPKPELLMPRGDYAFEVRDERSLVLQAGKLHFGATPTSLVLR